MNKIYNEDCRSGLKKLENDSVDLTITSPPYNINANKYQNYNDNKKDYYGFLVDVTDELLRVTKHYTFFNMQLLNDNKIEMFEFMHKYRYNIKDIIIWVKQSTPPVSKCLYSIYEYIFVLAERHKAYNRNFERCNFDHSKPGKSVQNVVKFNWKINHSGNHAVFPEELIRWILTNFGRKEDVILDPFMGTGTTALIASQMGMKYLGFEINKDYIAYSNKRLSQKSLLNIV